MQQEVIKEMVIAQHRFEEIQKELERQFGEHALKKSAIYRWMQKAKLGLPMIKDSTHSGNSIDEQLLITIQEEIEKNEFFSIRSIAHNVNAHPSLIYRYLTQQFGFVFKHTRYIPHSLNFEQKKKERNCLLNFFKF